MNTMQKTFSIRAQRLVQPFFNRFRQRYRGHRTSLDENREANFFLLDINIIDAQLELNKATKSDLANNFIGKLNNLSELEKLNHGQNYDLSDIEVYYQDVYGLTEPVLLPLVLPKAGKLSSILERLERKVKILESTVGN